MRRKKKSGLYLDGNVTLHPVLKQKEQNRDGQGSAAGITVFLAWLSITLIGAGNLLDFCRLWDMGWRSGGSFCWHCLQREESFLSGFRNIVHFCCRQLLELLVCWGGFSEIGCPMDFWKRQMPFSPHGMIIMECSSQNLP